MWRWHNRSNRQQAAQARGRTLLLIGCSGMMVLFLSSCTCDNDELNDLRMQNKRIGDGINEILKKQNEKRSPLEKSLQAVNKNLEGISTKKKNIGGDTATVSPESKAILEQSLSQSAIEEKRLEKEKAALEEKIKAIDTLQKELNALFSDPKKAVTATPAAKL